MPIWLTWALVRRVIIVVGLILVAYYLVTFVQVITTADELTQEVINIRR